MQIKAIAAMSLNRVIGKDNTLPWHIPEELKWFKEATLGHILVMGRKTFESVGCKALPKRTTYVLSRSPIHYENVKVIQSLSDLSKLEISPEKIVWIAGGEQIYQATLPYCQELYLTEVNLTIENGTAFFPEIPPSF